MDPRLDPNDPTYDRMLVPPGQRDPFAPTCTSDPFVRARDAARAAAKAAADALDAGGVPFDAMLATPEAQAAARAASSDALPFDAFTASPEQRAAALAKAGGWF